MRQKRRKRRATGKERGRGEEYLLHIGEAEGKEGIGEVRLASGVNHLVLRGGTLLGAHVDLNKTWALHRAKIKVLKYKHGDVVLVVVKIELGLGFVEELAERRDTRGSCSAAKLDGLEGGVQRL